MCIDRIGMLQMYFESHLNHKKYGNEKHVILILLLVSCTSKPRMITAKHKTVKNLLVYRYKQSGKQIDSISFKYLDSLDVTNIERPSKYYFF
jgi:hypothetical protein